MTTERRKFRPFDVATGLSTLLHDACLVIGEGPDRIERNSRRMVDVADMRSGDFTLEIAADDSSFASAKDAGVDAATEYEGGVEFVVVVSSGFLRLADVAVRVPLAELDRHVPLVGPPRARAFGAIHHGCDVDAYLVLAEAQPHEPLRPWREATWLSRAHFEIRTSLDGLGLTLVPLTDGKREELRLAPKTLRYLALEESPLEMASAGQIVLYVDEDLLARLNRSPRKDWARAFSDQLAVDVLTGIALRALADETLRDTDWDAARETLLGSLVTMVAGQSPNDELCTQLLDLLRDEPQRFVARIEAVLGMRDAGKLIAGGGS